MTVRVIKQVWNGDSSIAAVRIGGQKGLEESGDLVHDAANQDVPFNTGQLLGTGFSSRSGDTVTIGYGTAYAVLLHAHPEWNFQGSGRADWLERALEGTNVFETIGAGIQAALMAARVA